MKKQNELEPTAQPVELKKLSDTRWACQYTALCVIRKTLPSIVATLQDIMGQPNPRRKTEARAIHGLIDEHFALLLTLFEDLFQSTKFMSDQLQSPSLELSSELAQSVIDALSAKWGEEFGVKFWRERGTCATRPVYRVYRPATPAPTGFCC